MEAAYRDGIRELRAGLLREPYRLDSPFGGADFALLLVASEPLSEGDKLSIAADVLAQGCRYAVCVGVECESWEDACDEAHTRANHNMPARAIPPLMTTSHPVDPWSEVASFFAQLTYYDDFVPRRFLILVVGGDELSLARYRSAVVTELRRAA